METFLKLNKGNVELFNGTAQRIKTFYSKGDAIRVDWYEKDKGSIQVQLANGKLLIINSGCQVIRTI